jgi:transcriptional regulator with GAF, ATPase, and Fis domain
MFDQHIYKKYLKILLENFQIVEVFISEPNNDLVTRVAISIRPNISENRTSYEIISPHPLVIGQNKAISSYQKSGLSLTGESAYGLEMIVVQDLDQVNLSMYSYKHRVAYEREYKNYLIKDNSQQDKPRLKSMIIVPIFIQGVAGILRAMNKFKQPDKDLFFDDINEQDIDLIKEIAVQITAELTYRRIRTRKIKQIVLDNNERKIEAALKQDILGDSPAIQSIIRTISKASFTGSPILFTGETGTGKTAIARALFKTYKKHFEDDCKGGFVPVNMSAIPEGLMEAELFGAVKNAGTNTAARPGFFNTAQRGAIFLDEIGEINPSIQAKLLTAIDNKEIYKVGDQKVTKLLNIRIWAATNREIHSQQEQASFRRDLYFRFPVHVHIPPLRERREDIEPLINHFLKNLKIGNRAAGSFEIDDEVKEFLVKVCPLFGNARELKIILERSATLLESDEKRIKMDYLPRDVFRETDEYWWVDDFQEGLVNPTEENLTKKTIFQLVQEARAREAKKILLEFCSNNSGASVKVLAQKGGYLTKQGDVSEHKFWADIVKSGLENLFPNYKKIKK